MATEPLVSPSIRLLSLWEAASTEGAGGPSCEIITCFNSRESLGLLTRRWILNYTRECCLWLRSWSWFLMAQLFLFPNFLNNNIKLEVGPLQHIKSGFGSVPGSAPVDCFSEVWDAAPAFLLRTTKLDMPPPNNNDQGVNIEKKKKKNKMED